MLTGTSSRLDPVCCITRAAALAQGALVDARAAPFQDVTPRYFRVPVAMTSGVFAVIKRAVDNPRSASDYPGVWRHVCSVLRTTISRQPEDFSPPELRFRVSLPGAGRSPYWTFKSLMGPDEQGEPCLTILLVHET
jgi:hypothetical protein